MTVTKPSETLEHKVTDLLHEGFNARAFGKYRLPEALGDSRWTDEMIVATWYMAETGEVPPDLNYKTGRFRPAGLQVPRRAGVAGALGCAGHDVGTQPAGG